MTDNKVTLGELIGYLQRCKDQPEPGAPLKTPVMDCEVVFNCPPKSEAQLVYVRWEEGYVYLDIGNEEDFE